ncbi:Hypothetical predicted protein [Paramuricea clavata]|uniref:Uncharacterized protein n=1 Tax=Paramuricea clavata TaxID=317549 RepID=A0A6S7HV36_PARCT|nr:Hypothetical predicted protein [Paramuricea clavata]
MVDNMSECFIHFSTFSDEDILIMDPFQDDPQENGMVSLSSGTVAPEDVVTDLDGAFDKGNDVFEHSFTEFCYSGELADNILARILAIAHNFKASHVDFIADRYLQLSMKNAEQEKQASHSTSKVRIYGRDQKVFKPWKFISSGRNKESLIAFLVKDEWVLIGRDPAVRNIKERMYKVVVC